MDNPDTQKTLILDLHIFLLCYILNDLGSFFHSTRVVVGFLAASDFTPSRGSPLLTFVTDLTQINELKVTYYAKSTFSCILYFIPSA